MGQHRAHGVADRFRPFGTTIFAEMTAIAQQHRAVNLSQGFPDFDGPDIAKDAAARAMAEGENQYAPMGGMPALTGAIASWWRRATDAAGNALNVDPATGVTVTNGCTEALAAVMLGLLNPGDEVILFEPFYDSYRACVAMAGAKPRFVTLRPEGDGFEFDEGELRRAFGPKTRAIVVNTPHNPTGKVFTREELGVIASLCREHGVLAITDEVYERLTYDEARPHVPLAALPGMRERTVTLSSIGKTFSLTGWKIGWAIAPPELTAGVRAAHQFLSYAVARPLQLGAAAALTDGEDYVHWLREHYRRARDRLGAVLADLGFGVHWPAGSYFIMADHTPLSRPLGIEDDVSFCRYLASEVGVAAIPPSAFYDNPGHGRHLVRFAFCKTDATLDEATRRLATIGRSTA